MPREQLGVCAEGNLHSVYLMFNANDGIDSQMRPCVANVAQYIHELADQFADSAFNGFVAIGANYWDTLYPAARPNQLKPFPAMNQDSRDAPAIEYDLFVHLRGDRFDILHLVANEVCQMFDGLVELVDEERGFRFMDSRDLTGFVDGTENPKGLHRQEVALVSSEDNEFRGGSYIHIQRYVHDLTQWDKLKVKSQEDIIGRTKQDNHEYSSFNKPKTSHIRRTGLKDDAGNSVEILRQSMPYGDMKEQGLFFISCCKTPLNFELMLRSMIVGDNKGHYDHLLKYTQAVTGAAFFAPAMSYFAANS